MKTLCRYASLLGLVAAQLAAAECPERATAGTGHQWFYVEVSVRGNAPIYGNAECGSAPACKDGPTQGACVPLKVPTSTAGFELYCRAFGATPRRVSMDSKWPQHGRQNPFACRLLPEPKKGLLKDDGTLRRYEEVPKEQRAEYVERFGSEVATLGVSAETVAQLSAGSGVREGVLAREVLRETIDPACGAACASETRLGRVAAPTRKWVLETKDAVVLEDWRDKLKLQFVGKLTSGTELSPDQRRALEGAVILLRDDSTNTAVSAKPDGQTVTGWKETLQKENFKNADTARAVRLLSGEATELSGEIH